MISNTPSNRYMKLFISGNRSISHLSEEVLRQFQALYISRHGPEVPSSILVGDASGVDWYIQQNTDNCVVYYSGTTPRHYKHEHKLQHVPANGYGRAWHTCKDVAMSKDCGVHIGFIDTTRSNWRGTGTVANHIRVLGMGKPSALICVHTNKEIHYE